MSLIEWAEKEVEIACKKENPNRKEGEFDYECACYESALKAFKSLCEDGHTAFSIKMTQSILNRLIDCKPLTPIEDTYDSWNHINFEDDGTKIYQNKRMFSLFKHVYPDGCVTYNDSDCYTCIDVNNPNNSYNFSLVWQIINEMFPISMPYMPGKMIKVYCEDFLVDEKNGDFDTVGVFYALKEENGEQNRIEINRFFRAPIENEEGSWIEISKEEYYERKAMKIK